MTITELWTNLRLWLDDSNSATYKWTEAELVNYFNHVMDDIACETDAFKDVSTTAIVEINITAGTPDYAYDTRVLEIIRAQVSGESTYLSKVASRFKNETDPSWRVLRSAAGSDIAFATSSITSTTTDFLDEGFTTDDFIVITGSTSNNTTIKAGTVTSTTITLASGYTLTEEVSGDNVTLKVLYTGTPTEYMLDYKHGYVTLSPCPDTSGRLMLETVVKQVTPLTTATTGSYTIPLDSQYHFMLVDGVLSKAYLKSGPSTFNLEKASAHQGLYRLGKDRMKLNLVRLRGTNSTYRPHSGAI